MMALARRMRQPTALVVSTIGLLSLLLLLWRSSTPVKLMLSGSVDGPAKTAEETNRGSPNDWNDDQDDINVFAGLKSADHPVKILAQEAEEHFNKLLARQSRTYEAAEAEYVRRYRRSPPPGFKAWFEYAIAEDSPLIDDFDVLDSAIAPLLHRSGKDIQQRTNALYNSDSFTWSCKVYNGRLQPGCESLGEPILRLFSDARILDHLRNVDMIVNGIDEPRVLSRAASRSQAWRDDKEVHWEDQTRFNVWNEIVERPCEQLNAALARRKRSDLVRETHGLPFIRSSFHASDLCQHPEYQDRHGFFISPTNLKVTYDPVPIMSPAVPSTMGDIPFPATAYNWADFSYTDSDDVAWEDKIAGLYWAGKTTGGYQQGQTGEWKKFHRHRFVSLVNGLEQQSYAYLQHNQETGQWERTELEFLNATSYHVYFTEAVQCEDEMTCGDVRAYYNVHSPDPSGEVFRYTLDFDTDGNGHSGRYYRLLASRSLPLKQTVFREWHDDRLQPWVHYVPVSLGMEELPEIVRYLVEEQEGRELAQKLAMKGRAWASRALRPTDQAIYLYRAMLELARVQDVDRKAS